MKRLYAGLALLYALGLAGCATTGQPERYFTLEPVVDTKPLAPISAVVALGPVDVPDYLNRPQIVTRRGGNELIFDEFNRWGGPLEDEVSRLLVRQLGQALGRSQVVSYPSRLATSWDFRVALELKRFDGRMGGDVVLIVDWSLLDEELGQVLLTKQGEYATTSNGDGGYAGYAQALSRLAGLLGRDISEAIREADRRGTKKNPPQSDG